jgi:hypothetical protein
MVKNIKASMALGFMVLSVCCFIEMFNVHNSENQLFALMASFNVCMIIAYLFLRWAK